jgi:hypothetical protein
VEAEAAVLDASLPLVVEELEFVAVEVDVVEFAVVVVEEVKH